MGLRFEKPACTWRDLHAMFTAAPPGSAIHYEMTEKWSLDSHLMASMLERLNDLVWMKTKDAQRKPPRNRPKPIKRPGVAERENLTSKALGGRKQAVIPMTSFARLWKQKARRKESPDE